MSEQKIRVAILGAGLMGHGIAQVFALSGFEVSIWDPHSDALQAVPQRISEHLALLGDTRSAPVRLCESLKSCVADCHMVTEAAPENMALKQDLVLQIEAANETCVIASNTSVLRITEIAKYAKDPNRVVGTHWWNPPYLIPIVEIVRGQKTSEEVAAQVTKWLRAAGKLPVDVFKDAPGFVGNRMQFAMLREAAHIVEDGICSAETVDLVARHTFGRRIAALGPLRSADYIGLDLVQSILDYLGPSLFCAAQTPELINKLVAQGDQGAKSGKGIFAWAPGEREETERSLLKHLLVMQSLEVAADTDTDTDQS